VENEPAMAATALGGLRRSNDPEHAKRLLAMVPKADAALKPKLIDALASKASFTKILLAAVEKGSLKPTEVSTAQLQTMALHDDAGLKSLIEKHWGKIGPATAGEKKARVGGIRTSLGLAKGDPAKGKELFKQHCGNCHTLFGEGSKVGPELTGTDRRDLDFLLTSIVDPSAVVRREFMSHVIRTVEGQMVTGLVAEATPTSVTVLDAKNQRTTFARSDIESMKPAAQSLMPEKLLDALDAQQVRDLVSYLQQGVKK
jgi:putative heme-binding domain-containing protein